MTLNWTPIMGRLEFSGVPLTCENRKCHQIAEMFLTSFNEYLSNNFITLF